jgi:DNA-binding IclR family transcriptional regulator
MGKALLAFGRGEPPEAVAGLADLSRYTPHRLAVAVQGPTARLDNRHLERVGRLVTESAARPSQLLSLDCFV